MTKKVQIDKNGDIILYDFPIGIIVGVIITLFVEWMLWVSFK